MKITRQFLLAHPAHFFGLGFGSGLSPKAPGTVGTVAAIPIWFMLAEQPFIFQSTVLVMAFFIGIYFCGKTGQGLGVQDHGAIVWDEFVGFWLTMMFAPPGFVWVLLGFILFRLFDIWKPWPISYLDRHIHGGLGVMLDDVVAGLFAGLLLYFFSVFQILFY